MFALFCPALFHNTIVVVQAYGFTFCSFRIIKFWGRSKFSCDWSARVNDITPKSDNQTYTIRFIWHFFFGVWTVFWWPFVVRASCCTFTIHVLHPFLKHVSILFLKKWFKFVTNAQLRYGCLASLFQTFFAFTCNVHISIVHHTGFS